MLFNLYATVRSPPPLTCGRVRGERDRSDPELAEHLRGLQGYVSDRGERPMTARLMAVLRHVDRVQHHRSIEVNEAELPALRAWATAANAMVFCTDGTLRDPELRIAIAQDPRSEDPEAAVPYPAEAHARKQRTMATLGQRGLKVIEALPPVGASSEVVPRRVSEVATRCDALLACALRGQTVMAGAPLESQVIASRLGLSTSPLSPREEAFFHRAAPEMNDANQHMWSYEALWALLWARGVVPELRFPEANCDVAWINTAMFDGDARTAPTLRPHHELLDALDLHYRLQWILVDARVTGTAPPAGTNGGVVFERYRALNWVTGCDEHDWDDVDTST